MKTVFFLVALANIALFMWEYNKGSFEAGIASSETAAYPGQEKIALVGEQDNDRPRERVVAGDSVAAVEPQADSGLPLNPEPDNKNEVAQLAKKKDRVSCYEAGPFDVDRSFEIWYRQLASSGTEIKAISREDKAVDDYLVFYPAAETMEQSEADLQMLKDQGLKDFWVVRKGAEKGQILLGIFSREERAIKMKSQLQAKGINADIRARYKNKTQKYALIKGGGDTLADLEVLKKTYPNIAVNPRQNAEENCLQNSTEDNRTLVSGDRIKPSENPAGNDASRASEKLMGAPNNAGAGIALEKPDMDQKSKNKQSVDEVQPVQLNPDGIPEKTGSGNKNSGTEASATGNAEVIAKEPRHCYEAGPFANEKQLGEWGKLLTAVDAEFKLLSKEGQSAGGYVVYYPAAATLDQSEANLQMLKNKGLVDVWMLRKGDEKGQISLGVFNKEDRALLMKSQMQAKGISAEVKARYKNTVQKFAWIKGGDKVLESLKSLEKTNPGISVKPATSCSE
jgi:hypothetical protein